jgi:phosphopantetheine adenylyltransferase
MNQSLDISKLKERVPTSHRRTIVSNQENVVPTSIVSSFITKFKAKKEANQIIRGLKEVKDFESGKKQPKSFDDFLKEL